jgi:hypothetical protein
MTQQTQFLSANMKEGNASVGAMVVNALVLWLNNRACEMKMATYILTSLDLRI